MIYDPCDNRGKKKILLCDVGVAQKFGCVCVKARTTFASIKKFYSVQILLVNYVTEALSFAECEIICFLLFHIKPSPAKIFSPKFNPLKVGPTDSVEIVKHFSVEARLSLISVE